MLYYNIDSKFEDDSFPEDWVDTDPDGGFFDE